MAEDWSEEENQLVVEAYFVILAYEMREARLVKVELYREIARATGRGAKAVEFKMMNVSGALRSLGLGYARGLQPYGNFQAALLYVLKRELEVRPEIHAYLARAEVPGLSGEARGEESLPLGSDRLASGRNGEVGMRVEDLWNYATGGSDVAALPGRVSQAPVGPRPAAVDEAVEWMKEALSAAYEGERRFLFLVGGPGGGKSHVAARLTRQLELETDVTDGLAHRSYTFRSGSGPVLVVNDATIPTEGSTGKVVTTLSDDLSAFSSGHVIACVNRGVLVDEAVNEDANSASVGVLITSWLRDETPTHSSEWSIQQNAGPVLQYMKQATVRGPGHTIEVAAVFVDVCSLLEATPAVATSDGTMTGRAYQIARFSPKVDRLETPAGSLISEVVREMEWGNHQEWDPVSANLYSLGHGAVRNGVLSVLRAAELATSQRFSYRQVWGIISRCVAGPLPEQINAGQLGRWLDRESPKGEQTPKQRFEAYRSLSRVRLHEAIFGDDWAASSRHPILSATSAVDPSRDMVPGNPKDDGHGWASPVSEAFAGAELAVSPLVGLRSAAQSEVLDDYITDFDEALDDAFVDAIDAVDQSVWRARATSWYGRYLTRMLAVAHGYPAYAEQVESWTRAWELGGVEEGLAKGLQNLVRPPRNPRNNQGISQVPLFGSRAEAVLGDPERPALVVGLAGMTFTTRKRGEQLYLQILRQQTFIGEVLLDLDLVREASVSAEGWLGLTDATESVVPRLERFRSLNLIAENREQSSLRVIGPRGDRILKVEEEGH